MVTRLAYITRMTVRLMLYGLKSVITGLTRVVEGTIVHDEKIKAGEVIGVWKYLFDLLD